MEHKPRIHVTQDEFIDDLTYLFDQPYDEAILTSYGIAGQGKTNNLLEILAGKAAENRPTTIVVGIQAFRSCTGILSADKFDWFEILFHEKDELKELAKRVGWSLIFTPEKKLWYAKRSRNGSQATLPAEFERFRVAAPFKSSVCAKCLDRYRWYIGNIQKVAARFPRINWVYSQNLHTKLYMAKLGTSVIGVAGGRNLTNSNWIDTSFQVHPTIADGLWNDLKWRLETFKPISKIGQAIPSANGLEITEHDAVEFVDIDFDSEPH